MGARYRFYSSCSGGGAGGDGGLVVGNDVAAERLQAAASGHLDEQRG
jgi:hypothetical protein